MAVWMLLLIGVLVSTNSREVNSEDVTSISGTPATSKEDVRSLRLKMRKTVLVQDDSIAAAAYKHRRDVVYTSNVLILDDKTFSKVKIMPVAMVLFHHSLDAKSQLSLRVFAKAADALKYDNVIDTLAAVDCADWTYICQNEHVKSFPTILIYSSGGKEPEQYTGALSISALTTAAKLYQIGGPLDVTSPTKLNEYFSDNKLADVTDLIVIGVFNSKTIDDPNSKTFRLAAQKLRGQAMTVITTDEHVNCQKFSQISSSSCIIVRKRYDHLQPHIVLSTKGTVDDVVHEIYKAFTPLFAELDVAKFPSLMSLRSPFVIAFANRKHHTLVPTMESIAQSIASEIPMSRSAIFTWMDTSKPDGIAKSILEHHVKNPRTEELLIIHPSQGTMHQFTDKNANIDAVQKWVIDVLHDRIPQTKLLPKKSWKPKQSDFDFLRQMDLEAQRKTKDHETEFDTQSDRLNKETQFKDVDPLSMAHLNLPTRDIRAAEESQHRDKRSNHGEL